MSQDSVNKFLNTISGIAVIILFLLGAVIWVTIPEVYISHSTGECVKVIPEKAGDCSNLPKKYNAIMVR